MLKIDYPEFEPIIRNSSFCLLVRTLYYASLLRYTTQEMLKDLTKSKQIATKKNLDRLCDLGYLVKFENVFKSTKISLNLLIKHGYSNALLPEPAEGNGAELYTQYEIAKLLQDERCLHLENQIENKRFTYPIVLYPDYGYLIPDCLLILRLAEHRCRLVFIEIERKKPNWQEWIDNKLANYRRLAVDEQSYRYWQVMSQHLGLKCPAIKDFRFAVKIIKTEG